jgi:hypothetical protein
MAAPATVGVTYGGGFGTGNPWVITITNGFTAGNSVLLALMQSQSTLRTLSSIVASNGDTFVIEPGATVTSGGTGTGMTALYRCLSSVGMAAGGTITITWSANSVGSAFAQEITPVTSASLVDTVAESTNTGSHTSAATGLTTSGDVMLVSIGQLNGSISSGTATAGSGYTKLGSATATGSMFQVFPSATGLTTDQGPWSHAGATRVNRGAMAAFYAAGGGGRVALNTRSAPLGVAVGMGWRMPA